MRRAGSVESNSPANTGFDFSREQIAELCRPDSDVDILVEFAPGVAWGWDYFGLERELAKILGRPVDLATEKWLKPSVRAEILREARVVYAA